jgi:hypothetical protein
VHNVVLLSVKRFRGDLKRFDRVLESGTVQKEHFNAEQKKRASNYNGRKKKNMSSIDIQVNAILNRKQTVVVDSSRRTSGASENFTFTLPEIIKNVKNIRPVEVIMSNKLYNITGQTNLLEIYRDGVNIAIAIPSGNYDIDSLMLALNTIWNPQNISFTYTPATLKVRVEDTMGIPF